MLRISIAPLLAIGLFVSPLCALAQQAPQETQQTSPAQVSSPAPTDQQPADIAPVAPVVPVDAPVATPTPDLGILVPANTPVSVALTQSVSSGNANKGDTVGFTTTQEVDVNGVVVIAKGAPGQGTVTEVERAGGNGHGGKLGISLDWVQSVDGGKIALSTVNHASDGGSQKTDARAATVAGYLLLGPVGLFAHNFVHGRNVTIDTGSTYNVFVYKAVHVASTQPAAATPIGFDH